MKRYDFNEYHAKIKANIEACETGPGARVLTDSEKTAVCLMVGKMYRYELEAR